MTKTVAAKANERFMRGVTSKSPANAIAAGDRTLNEWLNILNIEAEAMQQRLIIEGKLFHRENVVKFQALRWRVLIFLTVESPRIHQEIVDEFAGEELDKLQGVLYKLESDHLVNKKIINGIREYHITSDGLSELNFRLHAVEHEAN